MVYKIPENTPVHQQVAGKVARWQAIWSKAESIYQRAEAELRQENWRQAFRTGMGLLSIGNSYWETTKYEELNGLIRTAREDGVKLRKAKDLAAQGGLDNLLAAIKLAQEILPNSYVAEQTHTAIATFGNQVLALAQASLDRRNLQQATDIVLKIPKSANLELEVQDFIFLAQAQSKSWPGRLADVEAAIAQAQQLGVNRPLYDRAQDLVTRWQLEIEAIPVLEQAQTLAARGQIADLSAAIDQAGQIPSFNPLWNRAQQAIEGWTRQIQVIEDRPLLERAVQIVNSGDLAALLAGIEAAKQIAQGRALYPEAQGKIRTWTQQVQRLQDQPLLDQAQDLSSNGDLAAAIDLLEQIQPGRVLYPDAQALLKRWQATVKGETNLENARRLAEPQTLDALVAAVQMADQVPAASPQRSEANLLMNQWSEQILKQAEALAATNLTAAIAAAEKTSSPGQHLPQSPTADPTLEATSNARSYGDSQSLTVDHLQGKKPVSSLPNRGLS